MYDIQNWPAYNSAQIQEKEFFMRLLHELCNDVEEPLYTFGRPRKSRTDMIFASALKVYTTFSLRRFMTDMKIAIEKGYIKTLGWKAGEDLKIEVDSNILIVQPKTEASEGKTKKAKQS